MNKSISNVNVSNVRVTEGNMNSNAYRGKSISQYDNVINTRNSYINDVVDSRKGCIEVESTVLNSFPNTPTAPVCIPGGVVARLPVVLAEFTINFNLHAYLELPEAAIETRHVKNKINVTQCMLLQPTNLLLVKGSVRKVIEYTTKSCSMKDGFCGEVRQCTIDVPFEFSTYVNFAIPPVKDHQLLCDSSKANKYKTENFNEGPFCEVITANVYEFDEIIGKEDPCRCEPFKEELSRRIEENMVIELTLQLLQNRRVAVAPISGKDDYKCRY